MGKGDRIGPQDTQLILISWSDHLVSSFIVFVLVKMNLTVLLNYCYRFCLPISQHLHVDRHPASMKDFLPIGVVLMPEISRQETKCLVWKENLNMLHIRNLVRISVVLLSLNIKSIERARTSIFVATAQYNTMQCNKPENVEQIPLYSGGVW